MNYYATLFIRTASGGARELEVYTDVETVQEVMEQLSQAMIQGDFIRFTNTDGQAMIYFRDHLETIQVLEVSHVSN